MQTTAGIVCVAVFVLFLGFELFGRLVKTDPSSYYYIAALFSGVVLIGASLFLGKASRRRGGEFFRLRTFRLRWISVTLCATVAALTGAALINLFFSNIGLPEWLRPVVNNPLSIGTTDPVAALLALVLVPAVCEELFIRGALLSVFEERGVFRSVLITAFVFSFLHGSASNLIATFFASLIYGYLTVACGSVYPAMVAHLLNNLLAGSLMLFGQNFFNIGYDGFFLAVAFILFFGSVCLLSWLLYRMLSKKAPTGESAAEPEGFPWFLAALGVLWVAKIVLSVYNRI